VTEAEQALLAPGGGSVGPGPAFAGALRRAGREAFGALGLPSPRVEEWRFTSLARFAAQPFAAADPAAAVTAAQIEAAAGPAFGPRLVFVNGRLRPELGTVAGLPADVWAGSLARGAVERADAVAAHLGQVAPLEGRAFVALNAAHLEDGALVQVPDGVEAGVVELVFATVAPSAAAGAHPRTLVVAGRGSRATVVETYLALGAHPALTNAVTEIALGDGAHLEHFQVQDQPASAFHFAAVGTRQAREARLLSHSTALGAALSRNDVLARLEGPGAEARLAGLYMADGERVVDNHSVVEHRVPHGTSRELFKGILDGSARAVFAGRVRVLEGAMKTDAHQMNSNLLLSRDAVVDSMPQLEIYADDVKCGHGGTVGELDAEALFYLRSRGLGLARARSLLIYAFAREMVELVGPPGLRSRLGERVAARLPDGDALREAA
jgi:Fe-S cluster assembly protein SufD